MASPRVRNLISIGGMKMKKDTLGGNRMTEFIENTRRYVELLDSQLTTGGISLRKYREECQKLCEEVDEKIEEVKSNMNAFDRLLGEPLKALGEWLHD